jgi:hypothetical protein
MKKMKQKNYGIWLFIRTGAWFQLLGNNKRKLPYSDKFLYLAIHAGIRLHNFFVNSEQ